jgi:hypothetical protein
MLSLVPSLTAVRRRLALLLAAVLAAAIGTIAVPQAQATDPEPIPLSYLFTIDSDLVRVLPGKGDFGRVVVSLPATATRFTDRPVREAEQVGVRQVLRAFGWSQARNRFTGKVPNAAVSIGGQPSQVVELRRAHIRDRRLVITVKSLEGALDKRRGAGSVFIDNADPAAPASQSMAIGYSGLSFTSTYAPDATYDGNELPTVTVEVYIDGQAYTILSMLPGDLTAAFTYETDNAYNPVINATVETTLGPDGSATVRAMGSIWQYPGTTTNFDTQIASWPGS